MKGSAEKKREDEKDIAGKPRRAMPLTATGEDTPISRIKTRGADEQPNWQLKETGEMEGVYKVLMWIAPRIRETETARRAEGGAPKRDITAPIKDSGPKGEPHYEK